MSVSKKRVRTKRTTFKNLHGVVGNKERFSDKKIVNVIAY